MTGRSNQVKVKVELYPLKSKQMESSESQVASYRVKADRIMSESKSSRIISSQGRWSRVASSQVKEDEVKSHHVNSGHIKSGLGAPAQIKAYEVSMYWEVLLL